MKESCNLLVLAADEPTARRLALEWFNESQDSSEYDYVDLADKFIPEHDNYHTWDLPNIKKEYPPILLIKDYPELVDAFIKQNRLNKERKLDNIWHVSLDYHC